MVPRPPEPALDWALAEREPLLSDPRRQAGTVVGFEAGTLVVRGDDGATLQGLVTAETNVVCPPQGSIDDGRVFNPTPPPEPKIGLGPPEPPSVGGLRDRHECPSEEISVGRRIVGAVLGRDRSGGPLWLGVALGPGLERDGEP